MLATWAPHYVTWPWWPDLDTNAAMALGWSRGVLPYRDMTAFAFPGQILLFRGLNSVFGPGTTWPIYALDVILLGGLVALLVAWSRRISGSIWPGLLGGSALLSYSTNLNFSLAAQRDWQASGLIVIALLILSIRPTRSGRIISAFVVALAVTFRPHVVVFGPALVLAVRETNRDRPIRTVTHWSLMVGVGLVLAFLPLMAAGIFDDFLRGVQLAGYGSRYSRATPVGMIGEVVRQATEFRWLAVPTLVGMLAWSSGEPIRREARIWLAASLGVLFYKAMHPFPHDYLDHPRWVVWSVVLGILGAIVVCRSELPGRIRLAAAIALLSVAVPSKPEFCNPRAAWVAIRDRGRAVDVPPPGYVHHMTAYQATLYPWDDYRDALDYLRDGIGPDMKVANLLGYQLSAVGAAGRLPVFRNESGLLWKSQVGWDDQRFIDQLDSQPDSVVVWSPEVEGPEPDLLSPELIAGVRRSYEPDRTFGEIEVWKRKTDVDDPDRPD